MKTDRRAVIIAATMVVGLGAAAQDPTANGGAPDETANVANTGDGLPVPRFVSLRTNPVNLRAGPGVRYPVEWVYVRRGLPVEVTAESDVWRRVRDVDGTEGWVHQTMLSGRRAAVIRAATGGSQSLAPLRTASAEPAVTVAQLEPGVVVTVQRCPAGAAGCRVEVAGQQGWLDRARLWGVYPDEIID